MNLFHFKNLISQLTVLIVCVVEAEDKYFKMQKFNSIELL